VSKSTRSRAVKVAVTGVFAAASTLIAAPAVGAPAPEENPVAAKVGLTPAVEWTKCPSATLSRVPPEQAGMYSCATYRVPIDHDNAALGTIDLALLKRAAAKPEQRIGSLFLNPGGPGGPGLTMPTSAKDIFEQPVLDRFDLIGFDPRGVGDSNPVRCFTTDEDAHDVLGKIDGVPESQDEISRTLGAYRDYSGFCKRNGGALLEHMSTKDVARDLDQLRAAVGDQKLNFAGFSYGTLIGATYANMFPGTTRAIILDGNVDPELRTADGLEYDRERAEGFESSLDAFLDACQKAGPKCAFGAGDPKDKFAELRTYLGQQPMVLPDGSKLDLSRFTSGVSGALYSPTAFPGLAKELQQLFDVLHPPAGVPPKFGAMDVPTLMNPPGNSRFDGRAGTHFDAPTAGDSRYLADDSYFAVNCADKAFSHNQDDVASIAGEWDRESPTFGRVQAFADVATCPVWPVRLPDAYRGPWNKQTENPVLVFGNYHDPATSYKMAQRMAKELGYARLVSVDAFGHCILGGSAGADKAATDYLTDLRTPDPGKVFQPDAQPFDPPPAH
jgi:pimeloyl-ACP methyl ester carboxylesterase